MSGRDPGVEAAKTPLKVPVLKAAVTEDLLLIPEVKDLGLAGFYRIYRIYQTLLQAVDQAREGNNAISAARKTSLLSFH